MRSDDKEERILVAALGLFAERGFHGTAVPEIAQKAEVGTGTLYRYFTSKEVLVNAVFRRWKQAVIASITTDFPFGAPLRQQFHVIFGRWLAFVRENPAAARFLELHHHDDYLDAENQALRESVVASVGTLLATAPAGTLRELPAPVVMAVVEGTVLGLLKGSAEGRITLDDTTIALAETCCWDAIAASDDR